MSIFLRNGHNICIDYVVSFCIGQVRSYDKSTQEIALACDENIIRYSSMVDESEPPTAPARERLLPILCNVLNFSSAVTLAVTAIVYGFLRDLQDSHGICTFHFVLNTAMLHAGFFYLLAVNTNGLLPNMCITNCKYSIVEFSIKFESLNSSLMLRSSFKI